MLTPMIEINNGNASNLHSADKRQGAYSKDSMWDRLNLSQQYAVCSLGQFGYLLTYVRSVAGSTLAILKQNDKIATINEAGVINVNPVIICRE